MEPVKVKGFEVRVGDIIERERGAGERAVVDIVGDAEEDGGGRTVTTTFGLGDRETSWWLPNDVSVWIVGER